MVGRCESRGVQIKGCMKLLAKGTISWYYITVICECKEPGGVMVKPGTGEPDHIVLAMMHH